MYQQRLWRAPGVPIEKDEVWMRRKADAQSTQKSGGHKKRNPLVFVRPVRLSDFQFIQSLSSTIDGYTVPPPYILWMFTRFQGELCLLAEDASREPLGYMLATSAGIGSTEVFIWQLATNYRGQRLRAGTALASYVRRLVRKHGIERIAFTAVPDSLGAISIAHLAKRMFDRTPKMGGRLPGSISATEREFHILP
jgi:hypothetical protein